jgi:predicted outer membrane repeat protein
MTPPEQLPNGNDRLLSFALKSGVEIYGGFLGNESNREQRNWEVNRTILSGDIGTVGDNTDNSYHVITASSGVDPSTRLDGFVISDGNANSNAINQANRGGGILNFDSQAIYANLLITNNNASQTGGGISNSGAVAPQLFNITFSNNRASRGGALFNGDFQGVFTTQLNLDLVTFTDNIAQNGGAIYTNVPLVINNATFTDNSALNDGGAIYLDGTAGNVPYLQVTGQITDNTATDGGAIYNFNGYTNLLNVIFRNNSAIDTNEVGGAFGGAILTQGNRAITTVTNGIFDSNSADSFGGALSSLNGAFLGVVNASLSRNLAVNGGGLYAASSSQVQVDNSIFWGNFASGNADEILSDGAGLNVNTSIVAGGYAGVNNSAADPLFVNANAGDLRVLPASAAINLGNNQLFSLPTDIGGNTRIFAGVIDAGAYEFVIAADQYGASHRDLISAYGYDLVGLTTHYFAAGRFEGRSADNFNELRYTASNPDLIRAFRSNGAAATEHYIRHGFSEGRSLTAFDAARYLLSYPDLLTAYGTDLQGATFHYVEAGFFEQRNPNLFPSDRYIASYPDLIQAFRYNLDLGSNHYLLNGRGEGRQITFDPQAYLNRYSDLQAAYGNDLVGATFHYINHGFGEGRSPA